MRVPRIRYTVRRSVIAMIAAVAVLPFAAGTVWLLSPQQIRLRALINVYEDRAAYHAGLERAFARLAKYSDGSHITAFRELVFFTASAVSGQTPAPPAGQPPAAPGLRKLTGEDEKRAEHLDEQIDQSLKADRWDEAIGRADELLALRTRVQGAEHFETVDAEWVLKKLRRVAPRPHEDRLEPLAKALGALTDALPPARRLIVLPSLAMAGIPVETLLDPGDARTVSYAPSATVFNDLREQPRPGRRAGLLALGDRSRTVAQLN
jgi:hypothetical protein